MKIVASPKFELTLTLDLDELNGIAKMIGETSKGERVSKFGLMDEESNALSVIYSQLNDILKFGT